jgi:lactam utilization protein B
MKIKELITHAAIIAEQGMIFLGKSHAECFYKARDTGVKTSNAAGLQGFFTNKGRFVSRGNAAVIAYKAKQVLDKSNCLCSEDLWSPRHKGVYKYDPIKGYVLRGRRK